MEAEYIEVPPYETAPIKPYPKWLAVMSSFVSVPVGLFYLLAAFSALIHSFKSLAVGYALLFTGITPALLLMGIYWCFAGLWLGKEYLDGISNPFERHIKALGLFIASLVVPFLALILYEFIVSIGDRLAGA